MDAVGTSTPSPALAAAQPPLLPRPAAPATVGAPSPAPAAPATGAGDGVALVPLAAQRDQLRPRATPLMTGEQMSALLRAVVTGITDG